MLQVLFKDRHSLHAFVHLVSGMHCDWFIERLMPAHLCHTAHPPPSVTDLRPPSTRQSISATYLAVLRSCVGAIIYAMPAGVVKCGKQKQFHSVGRQIPKDAPDRIEPVHNYQAWCALELTCPRAFLSTGIYCKHVTCSTMKSVQLMDSNGNFDALRFCISK